MGGRMVDRLQKANVVIENIVRTISTSNECGALTLRFLFLETIYKLYF